MSTAEEPEQPEPEEARHFAAVLDGDEPNDADLGVLMLLVERLRTLPLDPSPEFVSTLRQQLMRPDRQEPRVG